MDFATSNPLKRTCDFAQLHVHHNSKPFSKFLFGKGEYDAVNMSDFDLRRVPDFCTYIAVMSKGPGFGVNTNAPLRALGVPLSQLCDAVPLVHQSVKVL